MRVRVCLLLGMRKGKVCEPSWVPQRPLPCLPGVTLQHQGRKGTRLTPLSFHAEDLILTLVGPEAREQTEACGLYV